MRIGTAAAQLLWPTAGLRLNWRKLLYRQLCKGDRTPNFPFSSDFFGLRYEGNLSNSIEANILFYGAFEKPLLFFLRDTWAQLSCEFSDKDQWAFADVGANIGQHSLFMSQHAPQVFSFEPFPAVSTRLQHHISLNAISNIHLEEVALSDTAESLDFYAPTGRNQGIGSFDASTAQKGNVATSKMQLIRGDQFFERQSQWNIALMKVDVEGFEKKVLSGLQQTLKKHRPVIVCEVSYGTELSFLSKAELLETLPENYELLRFNTRNADGSKAKKRGSQAKRSGEYALIPLQQWRDTGQDDIIAVPAEKIALLPGISR